MKKNTELESWNKKIILENDELRNELSVKYNTLLENKNFIEGGYSSMSSEEKEDLLDHIQKLTDENNNLLLLNDKLSKRADDIFRE